MITARTWNGTEVNVSFVKDVGVNEGGYYCTIEKADSEAWIDDFCIHPNDCDCTNLDDVERYAREYVESIEAY